MNGINEPSARVSPPPVLLLAIAGTVLQWFSQPPLGWWPVAFFSLIPWLMVVQYEGTLSRRDLWMIWIAGLGYWMISLQGLRHAHPAIYAGWFALAAYLSVYGVLAVTISRRLVAAAVPLWIAAPVAWVGLECIRNYFATGISAAMLGHTMADVPTMVQIADTFGSYGVGFVIVTVNVALFGLFADRLPWNVKATESRSPWLAVTVALMMLAATIGYGRYRLQQAPHAQKLATFALIQRSEVVEYVQDPSHAVDMFYNYAKQSMSAISGNAAPIDAIVWPESMLSGGMFWVADADDAVMPPQFEGSPDEFEQGLEFQRNDFLARVSDLQTAFARSNPNGVKPQLIGGCGVIRYAADPQLFSGMIQVDADGQVADWYAKTHRVILGEYIPLLSSIPFLRPYIPLGLRLSPGSGAKRFTVGTTELSPNICIETAVERVSVNHLSQLRRDGGLPDAIVTVTNDGWFDDSSVIDHHLRCTQLVAIACRRPVLSTANNGPTAWIDSNGQIVERLATGSEGSIIATPTKDIRVSPYVVIGDWPARILALVCLCVMAWMVYERLARKPN